MKRERIEYLRKAERHLERARDRLLDYTCSGNTAPSVLLAREQTRAALSGVRAELYHPAYKAGAV